MCECYRQLGIQTASRHALETNVTCNQAVCPVVFHWTWPVKDALLSSTGRYGSDTVAIASGLRLTPGSGAGFSSITLAQAFAERLLSLADWSAGRAIAQDHALAERVVAIWDELITLDVVATNMMNLADSAPQPHENRTARRRMRHWVSGMSTRMSTPTEIIRRKIVFLCESRVRSVRNVRRDLKLPAMACNWSSRQRALRPRHVTAARTRFIPDDILGQFEQLTWPAPVKRRVVG